MSRRVAAVLAFSAVMFFGGILFLSDFSLASSGDFVTLASHDGVPDNNPTWTHNNCSTSTSADIYLILKSSSSSLAGPEIDLPACDSAKIVFSARSYNGVTASSSDIYLYAEVAGVENLLTIDTPTSASPPAERPEVDLSGFCGQKIKIIFKSPSATGSKGFGLDNIFIKYQVAVTNQSPVAEAGADKEAEVDEAIEFDGSVSSDPDGSILSWYWDFGSFQFLGVTTTHAFNASGTYQVYLTVTDNLGASSTPDLRTISVRNHPATSTATTTATSTAFSVGDILVNEILPAPSSGNNEWVELYNNTGSPIDLSGWVLLNKEGSRYSTTTLSGSIDPDDFLSLDDIVGSLNNSGDEIVLKDTAGQIISQTTYGDFSSCYDCAWARDASGGYALTTTATKNAVNIITPKATASSGNTSMATSQQTATTTEIKTATTTATTSVKIIEKKIKEVVINEIYPNPSEGQEEFVEFKNLSRSSIDLSGLVVADASGKKFKIASSTILVAGGYAVILRSQSNIALNNSGLESVSLAYADGELIDRVSYSGSRRGQAFARKDSGEWQWSEVPTPASENIFGGAAEEIATVNLSTSGNKSVAKKKITTTAKSTAIVTVPLEQVRNLENGSRVRTNGVVSVLPGVLGSQFFYIAGSGIQIYSYKKLFPEMKVGDYIEVTGEMAESGGERRIKITAATDIKVLEHREPPQPHPIATVEVGEDYEGSLVQIEGEVLEVKSRNVYIDDGSGEEAKVYIKNHIPMEDVGIKAGDKARIVGIVSQTSAGYRLLPRSLEDIAIIKGEVKGDFEAAKKEFGKKYYLAALVVFLAAIIIWLIYKWPNKKAPK